MASGCTEEDPEAGTTDTGADTGADMGVDATVQPLAIAGTYVDDFGGAHRISDESYVFGWGPTAAATTISTYNNTEGWIVGQNAEDHPWAADLWSRFDWTESNGVLYVCQSVFDGETEADALDAAPSDDSDPASGGCGAGFPWSQLVEGQGALSIVGSYESELGFFVLREDGLYADWSPGSSTHSLASFDNEARYLIAQNGASDPWNPDLWSRFDWTWDDATLYWCQSAFDAATAQDAEATEAPDSSDPANSGCGGSFPWTALTPDQGAVSIHGVWMGSDDTTYDFSDDAGAWTIAADAYELSDYDNAGRFAIAENSSSNTEGAGQWSRFDWTWDGGALFLCHTTGTAADAETAGSTPAPDGTTPATSGCNDDAWVELSEGT